MSDTATNQHVQCMFTRTRSWAQGTLKLNIKDCADWFSLCSWPYISMISYQSATWYVQVATYFYDVKPVQGLEDGGGLQITQSHRTMDWKLWVTCMHCLPKIQSFWPQTLHKKREKRRLLMNLRQNVLLRLNLLAGEICDFCN